MLNMFKLYRVLLCWLRYCSYLIYLGFVDSELRQETKLTSINFFQTLQYSWSLLLGLSEQTTRQFQTIRTYHSWLFNQFFCRSYKRHYYCAFNLIASLWYFRSFSVEVVLLALGIVTVNFSFFSSTLWEGGACVVRYKIVFIPW